MVETELSYDQTFACSENIGQNIWNKLKKSGKTGQNCKALISTFALF